MNICIEGLGLAVISGESLLGVGDIKASINSSFQGSERLCSSRGPGKSNIQASSECSWTIIVVLHQYMSPSMLVFPSYTESR